MRSSSEPPRLRRVLLTADTIGGVWTFAIELARGLAEHGVNVWLATMGARLRASQRDEVASLPHVRLHESPLKLEWMQDPWDDVARARRWLLSLAYVGAPDVIHLNNFALAAQSWPAPTLVTAHSCVASWWRAVKGAETPGSWSRYRIEVRRGLAAADAVVAPTQAMAEATQQDHGVDRVAVIPNGRDPAFTAPRDKEPFVLGVGRLWDEAKNLGVLAQIAAELPWPVRLAGDARAPDGRTVCLANTQLLGPLSPKALAETLAHASIYALPARYEPFGYSVLEAALGGCALVLGDIASLRENWEGAAWFVPPDRPDAWRNALTSLMRDPDRRGELARAARDRAQCFTTRRMAGGYLAVYGELLARSQRKFAAPLIA